MRKFPWGDRGGLEGCNVGGKFRRPLPVGTFGTDRAASGGVNFLGNVREWCADPGAGSEDWTAPVQGFSWASKGPFWTFPATIREPADHRSPTLGFRCVRDFPKNSEILKVLVTLFRKK
jgi:formylglycine-generating enzyme required for sulfatase activity